MTLEERKRLGINKSTLWHIGIWKDILDLEYKKTTIEKLYEKYDNKYAIQKLTR